jgi:hypothetical protein
MAHGLKTGLVAFNVDPPRLDDIFGGQSLVVVSGEMLEYGGMGYLT